MFTYGIFPFGQPPNFLSQSPELKKKKRNLRISPNLASMLLGSSSLAHRPSLTARDPSLGQLVAPSPVRLLTVDGKTLDGLEVSFIGLLQQRFGPSRFLVNSKSFSCSPIQFLCWTKFVLLFRLPNSLNLRSILYVLIA